MIDASQNKPQRDPRPKESDRRPTPGSDAADGDAPRKGFTVTPRMPARSAEADAHTCPWSGWRPDEEFGQGDEGFGEDA